MEQQIRTGLSSKSSGLIRLRRFVNGEDLIKFAFEGPYLQSRIFLNSLTLLFATASLLMISLSYVLEQPSLVQFFGATGLIYLLVAVLARTSKVHLAKGLLVLNLITSAFVLSCLLGKEAYIQSFFIPLMVLNMVLYTQRNFILRNVGISLSIVGFIILDMNNYDLFPRLVLDLNSFLVIKWSILALAFLFNWVLIKSFLYRSAIHSRQN